MRFEARELTSYAQPIDPGTLTSGNQYLSVQYVDFEALIPIVGTLVFVGKNLEADDTDCLYFQDVESYRQGIQYGSGSAEETGFTVCDGSNTKHIFEYERALEELMKCSIRRKKAQVR